MNKNKLASLIALIIFLCIMAYFVIHQIQWCTHGIPGCRPSYGCERIGGICANNCSALISTDGRVFVQDLPNSGSRGFCKENEMCCIEIIKENSQE